MAKTKAASKRQGTNQETPTGEEVIVCRRRSEDDRRQTKTSNSKTGSAVDQDFDDDLDQDVESNDVDAIDDTESAENPPARRKVQRRRQIDPTTCERDYTDDEIQFMHALDAYKRSSGRMFPTCSEILEVVRGLGYEKVDLLEDTEVRAPEAAEAGVLNPEAGDELEFASADD